MIEKIYVIFYTSIENINKKQVNKQTKKKAAYTETHSTYDFNVKLIHLCTITIQSTVCLYVFLCICGC